MRTESDGLAPKGCFISAEAVESAVRQIGETQKAARELNGRDWRRFCGICGRLKFVAKQSVQGCARPTGLEPSGFSRQSTSWYCDRSSV